MKKITKLIKENLWLKVAYVTLAGRKGKSYKRMCAVDTFSNNYYPISSYEAYLINSK